MDKTNRDSAANASMQTLEGRQVEYTPDRNIAPGDYVRKDGWFQRVLNVNGPAVFTEDGGVIDECCLHLSDIRLESEVAA